MTMRKLILTIAIGMCGMVGIRAQGFFNLTAEQVRIDTLLPHFTYAYDLGRNYADSTYTVSIDYPEFIPMTANDIQRYHAITTDTLPAMPLVQSDICVVRKRGQLDLSFVPLVFRDGKYQKLVSFKLTIKGKALPQRLKTARKAGPSSSRYASHSVLSSGSWAKIRVKESGVYEITESLIKQAGFTDLSKIKVFGYGGALQPEKLTGDYLSSTDDLKEVSTCFFGGKRLFYAQGPVTWSTNAARTRNPYSDYGYYFLTENDDEPSVIDSVTFLSSFYPAGEDYNTLYEVDDYAWFHGGRNLYDSKVLSVGKANNYTLEGTGTSPNGVVRVVLSAYSSTQSSIASIAVNDSVVGTMTVSKSSSDYDKGNSNAKTFTVANLTSTNTITITQSSGGDMRLDYIAIRSKEARPAPSFGTENFPEPEYVYRITNQDLHADSALDMVIVIPTSQKFRNQAERLKALHEQYDNLRVRIVPADEVFNEFSSGTPDATAYRRYMKMLYDRAESDGDMPRYLLLFGDGAWDNRMHTTEWRDYDPDDYLLCFESENSFSQVNCYVSDDYYCLLDDGEVIYGTSYNGKPDVAVGRLTARNAEQAEILVDKIEAYLANKQVGSWKNTVVLMGDDGNENAHMKAADEVAAVVEELQPAMDVKRIMWDAYSRSTSATGFSYPDVEKLVKKYMNNGALVFNYNGHGKENQLSHENVVSINDFEENTCSRLPLWVTASCDITPFDAQSENIGEEAMYNKNGGAIAFYGTTRTVYTSSNKTMNKAFTKHLFSKVDGKRVSIGEAVRLAKVEIVSPKDSKTDATDYTANKLHYVLLGDPALTLAYPETGVVIDSINGVDVSTGNTLTLKAGSVVKVSGRIVADSSLSSDFSGTLTATIYDTRKKIVCRLNNTSSSDGSSTAYVYNDYQDVVFNGSDSVRKGLFAFSFVVPKDISYSDGCGRMIIYAVNNDKSIEVSGETENIILGGSSDFKRDSVGPSIYCYLNSSSFTNGGNVNTTPYFFAEINDEDGINASGGGIGHDLQLTIDGEMAKTYVLNDYFAFDFGSYTRGTVGYSLPALDLGMHKLKFRAWDVLNNSSTVELSFNVVEGIAPDLVEIDCTKNPATTSTSFRIVHDRMGSTVNAVVDVFDMSGRKLWSHSETDTPSDNTMTIDWDLTTSNGHRLGTGVYLYRINLSCDGGSGSSKTKKLIVLSNK